MPENLRGQSFHWCCFDPVRLLTAWGQSRFGTHFSGQSVRVCLHEAGSPEEVVGLVGHQITGLALWALRREGDAEGIALALDLLRRSAPETPRLAFVAPSMGEYAPILIEAGAQIVASELPSIQRCLPRVLAIAPLSPYGYHPLTSGLIARLPWSHVAGD